ncbi:hypothetical protein [Myroides injenensis]|uniref:hypothetical protein n=1 Tax=Myroides injenensis TaxID=1183151 RepID=UPI00227072F3|nr:hypothetical protein [Myroides injenensis]
MYRFIFIVVALFSFITARAQIGSTRSRITLIFKEQQSLQITHPNVELKLDGKQAFYNGAQTGRLPSHIIVNSSRPYEVNVRSVDDFFQYQDGSSTLPVSIVYIHASLPGFADNDYSVMTHIVRLSTSSSNLIQCWTFNNSHHYSINYYIPVSDINVAINKPSGHYQTTLVYTLIPH